MTPAPSTPRHKEIAERVQKHRENPYSAVPSRPKAVEIFAGIGGTGLGLEQAGFHVAAAVELEDITGRYAAYNLPATTVHYGKERGDVRQLRGSALPAAGHPARRRFGARGRRAAVPRV